MIPAVLLTLSITAVAAPAPPPPDIDPWIARAMRTFEVPGLAIAIVKDDEVVLAKGYGVRKLGDATPVASFRTAYAYDNVLYLIAGELIETISGTSWEDFVATRILARVGMTGSNVRHGAAAAGGNVATPHAPVDGKVRAIRPFESDN